MLLKIQRQDGLVKSGYIDYDAQQNNPWLKILKFTSPIDNRVWEFIDVDWFECLIQLRMDLAKYHYVPLCNGARLDVYPSGMCRDMGGGSCAYILQSQKPASLEDLVDIFDPAPIELIASVEKQKQFFASWHTSFDKPEILKIRHKDGSIVTGELIKHILHGSYVIKFESTLTSAITCDANNFVECLTCLRTELAHISYEVICNGCRIDTHVFSRDISMYSGTMYCEIKHGRIPQKENQVYIFADTNVNLIASAEAQENFYQSWLESIKSVSMLEYGHYGMQEFPELYFRLIKIGDLPLMWLFDIDPSIYRNIDDEVEQADDSNELERFFEKFRAVSPVSVEEVSNELKRLRVLSSLSPEQVEEIGSLKGEAILGFIDGEILSLEYFRPNKVFKEFIQKVIAVEAPKDSELQAAALAKREGQLYIIDNRVAELEREATSPEDILGVFEIKDGQIIPDSYQPNENYSIFGNNGLMQLPASLHEALISALLSLSD
jgi:hypothetical protein